MPVFLDLLNFGVVISGVGFVSSCSTNFTKLRSENRTNQLASVLISQNMAAKLILGFAIVFAKFAFSSSKLNRIARPRTFLVYSFLEHHRNGEPVFLVLLDFGAVISGVGFVSCGQSYISSSTIKVVYILWILQSIVDV